jgi:hypothetical protein
MHAARLAQLVLKMKEGDAPKCIAFFHACPHFLQMPATRPGNPRARAFA